MKAQSKACLAHRLAASNPTGSLLQGSPERAYGEDMRDAEG